MRRTSGVRGLFYESTGQIEMTAKERRNIRIRVSVSETENSRLRACCPNARLGVWMRKLALNEASGISKAQSRKDARSPRPTVNASPEFISAMARVETVLVATKLELAAQGQRAEDFSNRMLFLLEALEKIIDLKLTPDDY